MWIGKQFFATLLSEFQYLFPLINFITLWVLFLSHLSLPWLSCSISFSTLRPNLANAAFFLILCYQLFHHMGNWNLLSGKDFYPSVPQWHLAFSHIFHDSFVLCSPIVSYIYHFPLLPQAFACTTFLSLISIFSTYFPMDLQSKPIMSSFILLLG